MSHLFSISLPSLISLLPQMEVSGIWCVWFPQITFHLSHKGVEGRQLGVGSAEEISPGITIIYENISPSAFLSCPQIFHERLKTCKKATIHQMSILFTVASVNLMEFEAFFKKILLHELKQTLFAFFIVNHLCFTNRCPPLHSAGSECVDPEDPNVIAENELFGAAASIEAAAKKLEQLKPRAKPKVISAPLNPFPPT